MKSDVVQYRIERQCIVEAKNMGYRSLKATVMGDTLLCILSLLSKKVSLLDFHFRVRIGRKAIN